MPAQSCLLSLALITNYTEHNAHIPTWFARKPLSFSLKSKLSPEERKLKVIGIILYWGEGYKATKAIGVDFANSDSSMIFIFLKFLREVCGVNEDKLRIYLYCYSNQNIDKIRRYWSRLLKVPIKQFSKPYVRKDFRLDIKNLPQKIL